MFEEEDWNDSDTEQQIRDDAIDDENDDGWEKEDWDDYDMEQWIRYDATNDKDEDECDWECWRIVVGWWLDEFMLY